MDNDEVLRQLSEIKLQVQSMYSHLENIKNQIPADLQEGCEIACSIIPELEMVIALQQDVLVYSKREDTEAVNFAKEKLAKFR